MMINWLINFDKKLRNSKRMGLVTFDENVGINATHTIVIPQKSEIKKETLNYPKVMIQINHKIGSVIM